MDKFSNVIEPIYLLGVGDNGGANNFNQGILKNCKNTKLKIQKWDSE